MIKKSWCLCYEYTAYYSIFATIIIHQSFGNQLDIHVQRVMHVIVQIFVEGETSNNLLLNPKTLKRRFYFSKCEQ